MLPDILIASTATVLGDPDNHSRLFDDFQELHHAYASLSGISAGEPAYEDIDLPWGRAIGPAGAANCLLELTRTTKFIRGIHQAILHQRAIHPGKKIGILYAGCGPYATLLTPMTTLFTADELGFTLLDINVTSLAAVKKLYQRLELTAYVNAFVLDDAATYRLPDPGDIHLVISETMNQALRREPQVRIMQNLAPQLTGEAAFIPQKITVSAQLTSSKAEATAAHTGALPERINLGPIYTIGDDPFFPPTEHTIVLPECIGDFTMLNLFTDIVVFGAEVITAHESSLTVPLPVRPVEGLEGRRIRFKYVIGGDPHFEHALIAE